MPAGPRVTGAVVAYRLFDIGYAIDLERSAALLAGDRGDATPERVRPRRQDARALQIKNPPLNIALGDATVRVDGVTATASVSARLFDFGVCALQLELPLPPDTEWETFGAVARVIGADRAEAPEIGALVEQTLRDLRTRIAPAVERPGLAPVSEDYVVFRVTTLRGADGASVPAGALGDELLVPLLVGERRTLSAAARRDLLHHRFSYYADDLTILTWDDALVIEPEASDRDVEYILEFANALLLELRVYDALLDAELPSMYDRVAAARRRLRPMSTRRFGAVLADVQTLVADVTEVVERAENSLKVTEDVYLARIYDAALVLFRASAWRRGIEQKLAIFRETYAMLNDEAQAARSELLEFLVLLVIVAELVLALFRH